MVVLKKKLNCATLVEVLVAITIIAISFFVALTIYLNVVKSSFSENKLRASILAEEIIVNTIEKELFNDETINFDFFRIEKRIKPYPTEEKLFVLIIEVFLPSNRLIFNKRQLILQEDEN